MAVTRARCANTLTPTGALSRERLLRTSVWRQRPRPCAPILKSPLSLFFRASSSNSPASSSFLGHAGLDLGPPGEAALGRRGVPRVSHAARRSCFGPFPRERFLQTSHYCDSLH